MRLWSFLQITPKTVGPDTAKLYEDQLGFHYSFDSTVANHARVKVNDQALIIDETSILGIGTITKIEIESTTKNRQRCLYCKSTKISARLESIPKYRCSKCKKEFDEPSIEVIDVISYKAFYSGNWKAVKNESKKILEPAYFSRAVQQSIRELNTNLLPESFIDDLMF